MKLPPFDIKPVAVALMVAGLLSACGGGGNSQTNDQPASGSQAAPGPSTTSGGASQQQSGNTGASGGSSSGNNSGTPPVEPQPTFAACTNDTTNQCSGENLIGTAAEVSLTDFGVQAYGKATSDLDKTVFTADEAPNATGLVPAFGGTTQVRLVRDGSGAVTRVALVLKNLDMKWDGATERPTIIETFDPTQGRVKFGTANAIIPDQFHDSSDIAFYDYATKGKAGTQANYANNRYFPRSADNPARCPKDANWCRSTETDGVLYSAGNWRNAGGNLPDTVSATRFHEDGDVHAGSATDGKALPGGSGIGAPFPGSKGFRTYTGFSYQYANLGTWFTADTVWIAEWTGQDGQREHSTNRRGVVAFGALTNPATIPGTGTVTYSGRISGRYASAKNADPSVFEGVASLSVNFATREVTIKIEPDGGSPAITFTATATLAAAGTNAINGTVDNGKLAGKVSARFFGPVAASGTQGPAETGGAFSLKNDATGEAVVGGFIARKQ